MNIAVIGLGATGLSLARHFQRQGHAVWGVDDRRELGQGAEYFEKVYLQGEQPDWSQVQACYISPGVSPRHPAASNAQAQGLKLLGELDLAYDLCRGDIVAITGTNGKSTTTALLGAILENAGVTAAVGGNFGTPFIDLVTSEENYSVYVLEVSSFQLESTERFRPKISVLLNISDDHFDRHPDMPAYIAAKRKVFSFQKPEDFAVINDDDLGTLKAAEAICPRKVFFSTAKRVRGVYAHETAAEWMPEGEIASSFPLEKCKLQGLHNLENISAAVACAKLLKIPDAVIQQTLESFQGLPHRIQWVAELDGVQYFDDSKATNVGAAVMSLASFEKDVVVILGGRDKGGDYAPLKPLMKSKVRAALLLGEAGEKIRAALQGSTELVSVRDMAEAVAQAQKLAPRGGTVLLSPACSSFDMFRDYHHRGQVFQECVKNLTANR